jgi:hypothetical protein
MAIIVVGGSSKGVGKTALVCGLISALPEFRWTAIKITTHDHGVDAPAFPSLKEGQEEEQEPQPAYGSANMIWEETSAGQGTDTARYLAAGAHRAFLCTPLLRGDPQAQDFHYLLDELWPHFGPGTNVIFESNTILQHVRPDLCLMVVDRPRTRADAKSHMASFKRSYLEAELHADALVVDCGTDRVNPDGMQPSNRPPGPIFYLASLNKISPEMLAWIKQRLPAPPQPNA